MKRIYGNGHCEVTFLFPEEIVGKAKKVHLVGDFNNWNQKDIPMKKGKTGVFSASLKLPIGKEYQYRYLVDGKHWHNDPEAEKEVPTIYADAKNSAVSL